MPSWERTPSLAALERLLDVSGTVTTAVSRRANLSVSELHALRHLARGPLGPADLSRILGVSTAASSGIVDRLVARGHAVRTPHSRDRRRTEVRITDQGLADVIGRLAPMFAALAALDASLSEEERSTVERYLNGAIAAMNAIA